MFVVVTRRMIKRVLQSFVTVHHRYHIVFAFLIRFMLVIYGVYHDSVSVVQYTDIDYKVFTDAARHIINNKSPYERHTYRYSPLIAMLLTPNLLIHNAFGKILFCGMDLIVGFLIRKIVRGALDDYENLKIQEIDVNNKNCREPSAFVENSNAVSKSELTANISMLLWLYNPMSIAIATRGNCDSLAGLLVLTTLYLLQYKKSHFTSGLIYGLAIHVRIYPIVYSLAVFMFLSNYSFCPTDDKRKSKIHSFQVVKNQQVALKENKKSRTIYEIQSLLYLVPNLKQLKFISGCLISLGLFTSFFYYMYGYKFLYETYIYHLVRTDTRHNFSLYFYLQYLTTRVKNIGVWQKILIILPRLVLLLVLSIRYGLNKCSLNFSILLLTIVIVTFNSVLTSQYFIWIMVALPLCWWQIKMSLPLALFWVLVWGIAQGAWLLPAYYLEFQSRNTFLLIWIQGVAFFCINIAILGRIVNNFMCRDKYKLL